MKLDPRVPKGQPKYMGDSVYANFDGFMITIYTDNGRGPDQVIHLELPVLDEIVKFATQSIRAKGAEADQHA